MTPGRSSSTDVRTCLASGARRRWRVEKHAVLDLSARRRARAGVLEQDQALSAFGFSSDSTLADIVMCACNIRL